MSQDTRNGKKATKDSPSSSFLEGGGGNDFRTRTNRRPSSGVGRRLLAFVDVSMSRQPAKNMGLLATIPTGCPSILAKPTVMFFAQSGMISKYVLSSTTLKEGEKRYTCNGHRVTKQSTKGNVWGCIVFSTFYIRSARKGR